MGVSRRTQLQLLLENLLVTEEDPDNKLRVYFQPPDTVQMEYPCIRYERDNATHKAADNFAFIWQQRYQVTYMDYNPDSDVIDKLMEFPYSRFDRHYATSGLNHDVFVIYH
jgi:hypothetical protein